MLQNHGTMELYYGNLWYYGKKLWYYGQNYGTILRTISIYEEKKHGRLPNTKNL